MSSKLKPVTSYPEQTHLNIIEAVSKRGTTFSYVGLIRTIQDVATTLYIKVGQNKAKKFAEYYYKTKDYILKKDSGLYVINEKYIYSN